MAERRKTIDWTRDKLSDLKEAREKAIQRRVPSFEFEEKQGRRVIGRHKLDVAYAGYLIQHLTAEFAKHPDVPAPTNLEGKEGQ